MSIAVCPVWIGLVRYIRPMQLSSGTSAHSAAAVWLLLGLSVSGAMRGCSVQRWSLSLGRWWGVAVYLHVFFVLSALLALAFNWSEPDLLGTGLLMVAILLASVTLHEVGHALAALRIGGKVDAIVLGPVGGLISPRVPDEPEI